MNLGSITAKLVDWVPPILTKRLVKASIPNLAGDRDVEWSWVAAHMPEGPGEAIDFGAGTGFLSVIAAQKHFNVTAVDLGAKKWFFSPPGIKYVQGDILTVPLPEKHFNLIINCSTVEHVGLAGRYTVTKDNENGDLEAMARLRILMKPGGTMLLTIPVGRDAVFRPQSRVYGAQRLPKLIEGYVLEKEEYWVKDGRNQWVAADKKTALDFKAMAGSWNPLKNVYALGCFVLKYQP
jgi:SAM-dependent methyltransferase